MKSGDMKKLIKTASGEIPADLVLKNGSIVNVFSGEILKGDIAVCDGKVAAVSYAGESDITYEGLEVIDLQGKTIVPGLIDAHVHIESSMGTPENFASIVIPHGTTTVIADCHEIANVCGNDGIRYMMNASDNTPLDVFFMIPSCVPATPFEDAGAKIRIEDMKHFIDDKRVKGLGEMMDYPGVLQGRSDIMDKLTLAVNHGKFVDGHGPTLTGKALSAYAVAGIKTDHECSSLEEMRDRLRAGMYVLIREGSAASDLKELIKGVNESNSRRCCFCTDDRQAEDIIHIGHIDNNVRLALKAGVDPVSVIRIATINSAECYGLKGKGAIAPGYDADFLITDNLKDFNVESVYINGILSAEKGEYKFSIDSLEDRHVLYTVHLQSIDKEVFKLKMSSDSANVISMKPGSLITEKVVRKVKRDKEGYFSEGDGCDLIKVAVIERHKGPGYIGLGLLENYGLKGGAVASSIAHDSHNIVVAGDNDEDMIRAVRELKECGGGITVVSGGKVLDTLELPIAGLMTSMDSGKLAEKLNSMIELARKELCINPAMDPFMTLAFLALPVIPDIKLTDRGLFDVKTFSFIDVSV
ncbi:adenine deaminase [Spirochaeta isovalerica]|uniref:Adenine deaminase n=1 Tax=Spirochaeta isovalerica TaxID=150 RepID=A0A841R862_9SPIO|nr:adenine deaminase [Spirochaeta isovalerica]MBB6479551.1 adenine deaminase [Spirochaeta isovalerica]